MDEEKTLYDEFVSGKGIHDLAKNQGRTEGAIQIRLRRLGLLDINDNRIEPAPEFVSYSKDCKSQNIISGRPGNVDMRNINDQSFQSEQPHDKSLLNCDSIHNPNDLFNLGLISVRLSKCLLKLGISDIRQTLELKDSVFLKQPNFGRKTFRELKRFQKTFIPPIKNENSDTDFIASEKIVQISVKVKELSSDYNALKSRDSLHKLSSLLKALRKEAEKIQTKIQNEIQKDQIQKDQKNSNVPWTWSNASAQEIVELVNTIILDAAKSPRSIEIIKLRFGFCPDYPPLTLAAIGKMFSISRERVRQIEVKIMRRLKPRFARSKNKEAVKLRTICNDVIGSKGIDFHANALKFSLEFFERDTAWRIATIILVCLSLEENLKKAEIRVRTLLREFDKEQLKKYKLEIQNQKIRKKWNRIFEKALLPSFPNQFQQYIPGMTERCREPKENPISVVGSFFSNRYSKEIKYESGAEFMVLSLLDSVDTIRWIQEQPIRIEYKIHKASHFYYPDIAVITNDNIGIVIEVKPIVNMILLHVLRKANAAIDFLHDKGIGYLMTNQTGRTLRDVAKIDVNNEAERNLLNLVDQYGLVDLRSYKKYRLEHEITFGQFASIVVRNDLAHSRQPFRLSRLENELTFSRLL